MYGLICLAAFLASSLTLFSGFGLGTLLMPVFAIFFSVDIAIALTAIVHLLNNLFKFFLLGKSADKQIVLRFGIPAMLSAFIGAGLLILVSNLAPLYEYDLAGASHQITIVKIVIALIMIFFAIYETIPVLPQISFSKMPLWLGGLLSGFFGGISGHQGAFRSAYLVKLGLSKESFIATGVVIACMVDVTRLAIYFNHFKNVGLESHRGLLIAATLSAFLGACFGNRLIKKVTLRSIQIIVTLLLIFIAVGLATGLI
jgi:uncharacterized protein